VVTLTGFSTPVNLPTIFNPLTYPKLLILGFEFAAKSINPDFTFRPTLEALKTVLVVLAQVLSPDNSPPPAEPILSTYKNPVNAGFLLLILSILYVIVHLGFVAFLYTSPKQKG
jgi:hypothetical protein